MVQLAKPDHVHLQWIPAHVGVEGNELADRQAKQYAYLFPQHMRAQLNADLPTLRVFLYHHLLKEWTQSAQQASACHHLLNVRRSNLSRRISVPRALQTLYSRWRLGEVESAGRYPRRLKWIFSPKCRACGHPIETTVQLLTTCPGTSAYRAHHSVSVFISKTTHEV